MLSKRGWDVSCSFHSTDRTPSTSLARAGAAASRAGVGSGCCGWELWTGVVSSVPSMWQVIYVLHNTRVNSSSPAPCAELLPLRGWRAFPGTPRLPHVLWDWDLSPPLVTPQSAASTPSPQGQPSSRAAGSICNRD